MFDILEHFPKADLPHVVSTVAAALRPGGSLVVRTPNMANPLGAYSRYMDITHEVGFTESSLLQLMHLAGVADYETIDQLVGASWRRRAASKLRDSAYRAVFRIDGRTIPKVFDKNLMMLFRF